MTENPGNERRDRAVSNRLSRLRSMPVDTSRLAQRLRDQIPHTPHPRHEPRLLTWFIGRPLRVAAVLLIGILLTATIISSGQPAMASADQLVDIHDKVTVAHSAMLTKVSSITGAETAINREWADAPALPGVPDEQVIACCVQAIGRKKMACVALEVDNTPVTMAVADKSDVQSPGGKVLDRGSTTYRVKSSAGVNMAMAERDGRWICLMGRVPVERLIETIEHMQF